MNVYAFYEPIGEPNTDYIKLIDIWKKSWTYYGWNPIVYGLKECKECNGYDEFYNVCNNFPTVNPKTYELYCFLRWLYMSKVGGWYADVDMINYGFKPQEHYDKIVTSGVALHCSSIYMDSHKYKNFIKYMMEYKITNEDYYDFNNDGNKVAHISDMHLLNKLQNKIDIRLDVLIEYPHNSYDKSLIVHYPFCLYSKKNNIGKSRSQIILEDPRTKIFMK